VSARPPRSLVVVDTNVFGAGLLQRTAGLADLYRTVLAGRPAVISFQTVAELHYGARRRRWGRSRMLRLEARIASAEVVWAGPDLLGTYVDLRVACEQAGHALGQRGHDTDRWIAATAVHLGVPLVSHDGVFRGVPGLLHETALDG